MPPFPSHSDTSLGAVSEKLFARETAGRRGPGARCGGDSDADDACAGAAAGAAAAALLVASSFTSSVFGASLSPPSAPTAAVDVLLSSLPSGWASLSATPTVVSPPDAAAASVLRRCRDDDDDDDHKFTGNCTARWRSKRTW